LYIKKKRGEGGGDGVKNKGKQNLFSDLLRGYITTQTGGDLSKAKALLAKGTNFMRLFYAITPSLFCSS